MTANVKRLITTNEELVLHNGVCVGVRARDSGAWVSKHPIIGRRWLGAIEVNAGFVIMHEEPVLGLELLFEDGYVTREVVGISAVPLAAA